MLRSLALPALLALCVIGSGPAVAGSLKDRVHADSFGNLVIYSASGYKRIIVGQGHAADGYNATGSYYEPEVVHLEQPRVERAARECWRPPYRWEGRSRMYGLAAHEVPQPPLVCR